MTTPKDFAEAVQARTKARRNLTTAANQVRNACRFSMPSLPQYVTKLDNAMQVVLDACLVFRDHAANEKVEDTTVNKMDMDEWEEDVDQCYTQAIEAYNLYRQNQQAAAAALAPPQQAPPVPTAQGGPGTSVYFKKRDLPSFSGHRKDWPEFKSLWTELVEKSITNPLALASELKKACKGEALKELEGISAGSVGSYEVMWTKLCLHYDDIVMSVFSALDELKSLKQVKRDDDYAGVIALVKGVVSVYKQLETLGQVNKVTAKEVSHIHFLLPPTVGREWVNHFNKNLTDA